MYDPHYGRVCRPIARQALGGLCFRDGAQGPATSFGGVDDTALERTHDPCRKLVRQPLPLRLQGVGHPLDLGGAGPSCWLWGWDAAFGHKCVWPGVSLYLEYCVSTALPPSFMGIVTDSLVQLGFGS